ncbi:MAG TPA: hypothetical protein VNW71_08855, partial [Thermoanaerobaculia bacterium]|nr:hypothetical protein [Thermoanaerobaculia bacterium]
RILGELSGSSRPSTRLETEPAPRSARPAPVELPAPWRLNLQGEPAPPNLLERWRTPGLDAPPRTQRPGASPGSPSRRSSQPLSKEEPRSAVPALEQSGEAPERRRSRTEEVEHQASTLLPPPPSLPPFLRANGAGDGLARRPASEVKTVLAPLDGPAAGEEDLDALAAKLQRILDEEARRHGIPV